MKIPSKSLLRQVTQPSTIRNKQLVNIPHRLKSSSDFTMDTRFNESSTPKMQEIYQSITQPNTLEVPWFPTKVSDFDQIGKRLLVFGDGIEEIDHPGCKDPEYVKRRKHIATVALDYKLTDGEIPYLQYNDNEKYVWKYCFSRLKELFKANAANEYNWALNQFEKHIGFSTDDVP